MYKDILQKEIKKRMIDLNKSASDLSRELDVSRQVVSQWLTTTTVSLDKLISLADHLDLDVIFEVRLRS